MMLEKTGLIAMIGKAERGPAAIEAIRKHGAGLPDGGRRRGLPRVEGDQGVARRGVRGPRHGSDLLPVTGRRRGCPIVRRGAVPDAPKPSPLKPCARPRFNATPSGTRARACVSASCSAFHAIRDRRRPDRARRAHCRAAGERYATACKNAWLHCKGIWACRSTSSGWRTRPDEAWEATLAKGERPAVVVALGPLASDFIVRCAAGPPVVHCLAGPDALRAVHRRCLRKCLRTRRLRGCASSFPPRGPSDSHSIRHEHAARRGDRSQLRRCGLQDVDDAGRWTGGIPAALDQIATRADVLLALPDSTVYTRESARGILLQSFRKRTPVIGPNDAWVRMGALYALDWDYDEVGAVCAQLASREVQGPRSAGTLPAPPGAPAYR